MTTPGGDSKLGHRLLGALDAIAEPAACVDAARGRALTDLPSIALRAQNPEHVSKDLQPQEDNLGSRPRQVLI